MHIGGIQVSPRIASLTSLFLRIKIGSAMYESINTFNVMVSAMNNHNEFAELKEVLILLVTTPTIPGGNVTINNARNIRKKVIVALLALAAFSLLSTRSFAAGPLLFLAFQSRRA